MQHRGLVRLMKTGMRSSDPSWRRGEGLLGKLSGVLGGAHGVLGKNGSEEKRDVDDDYQKFLEGLGDIG